MLEVQYKLGYKTNLEPPRIFVRSRWQCIGSLSSRSAFENVCWREHRLYFVENLETSAAAILYSVRNTYLVVLQLWFWSLSVRPARTHQSRPALALKLHNNRSDIGTFRASHYNSTANLIQIRERDIPRLVKDDGSLH